MLYTFSAWSSRYDNQVKNNKKLIKRYTLQSGE